MLNFILKNKSLVRHIYRSYGFFSQYYRYNTILQDGRFSCSFRDIHACLGDMTPSTGFDSHYLYHTAWAARVLANLKVKKHVDIGSCLRFASLVSAFLDLEYYDYRPVNLDLPRLISNSADLTVLPFADGSIHSLSCMHVVEHVGLGRYGDPVDPKGDLKAMKELARVVSLDGSLLFVVPVGRPKILFNANRIYSCEQIIKEFSEFELMSFAFVDDQGIFRVNGSFEEASFQNHGCGCFYFKKMNVCI